MSKRPNNESKSVKGMKGRSGWLWMPISLVLHAVTPGGVHLAAAATSDPARKAQRPENVEATPAATTHARQAPSGRQARNPGRVKPAANRPAIPRTIEPPIAVPQDPPDPLRIPIRDAEEGIGAKGGDGEAVVVADAESVIEGIPGGVREEVPSGVREEPLYAGFGGVSDPVLIDSSRVPPRYPELARQAGVHGKVLLQAVIRKDGTVGEITVLQSTGVRLGFDEAAVHAVSQWRYKPGLQNGRPVEVTVTILVDFSPPH